VGGGTRGDVNALAGAAERVTYTVRDARNNEMAKGTAQLNALGGFDFKLKLPATPNLGNAVIQFDAQGGAGGVHATQYYHGFQIQEFRRPEFEVTAQASEGPHFVGTTAQASVAANYFAGGGLPNAEVNWHVTSAPGRFTPPNRGDYTFGKWTPWWGDLGPARGGANVYTQTFKGRTDAAGRHHLKIDFDTVNPPQASTVTAQASVADVNRQTWTARTTMLVHPADLYVGLRSERTFVEQNQPLVVQSIVSDLDGQLVQNREVKMRAVLLDWAYEKGEWKQLEQDAQECAVRSTGGPVECRFTPKKGGVYRVSARVYDDRERPNESELTLWVAGGTQPPRRDVAQEKVELIPDRREYRGGEVAEILVQAPFHPAEGVLTLRRSGLVRTERFRMNEPSHTLRIPVEEAFTPNLHVQVDLVGAAARANEGGERDEKLPKRPAFAKGSLSLSVPPLARKLAVTATPRDKALEPGGETTVGVEVRDAAGRPVEGSELAVVVVDESVLALTGYRLEDPASVFYAARGADVRDYHTRKDVMLADPADTIGIVRAGGAGSAGREQRQYRRLSGFALPAPSPIRGLAKEEHAVVLAEDEAAPVPGEPQEEIRLRADFNALAVFAPSVKTGADGRAEVKVKVPDNLTRYRVMAVSVAGGKQFGSGESAITARMPLMVRPSA
ncbi:MAG TPA: alpha-2-macroglobulin family protein, partial [Pyrinomonadaceae bacterium]|nr:alpha-2-macroglobulin family protein [Pyrinomonadaceae bacterium]